MAATYTVSDYLIDRLKEIGAEHVFAVPGDYAGAFLSTIDQDPQQRIARVPTTNEWVAGYAADAYARLKGAGAMCLTYGVGTFGVLNALAGSYVEEVPVILIIGSPSFDQRGVERHEGVLYHHSTGTLTADVESVKNVTVAREVVRSGRRAPRQIDRALREALAWKRPAYLEFFSNAWAAPCRPPAGPLAPGKLPQSQRRVERAVERTLEMLRGAPTPVAWAGVEIARFGLQAPLLDLLRTTALPWASDLCGKGLLPESTPGFLGVFDGASSVDAVMELFDTSGCVLGLGPIVTDDFAVWAQARYPYLVLAHGNAVRVGRKTFADVPLAAFLARLLERVKETRWTAPVGAAPALEAVPTPGEKARALLARIDTTPSASGPGEAGTVTYNRFFERIRGWVDDSMVLLADTSIVLYSAAELPVNREGGFIAQAAWNSIGFTPGAALGVGFADPGRRAVVFCGDGGFQEIAPAVSDLVRAGHDAVVFVFNNALYGIEQAFVDPYYFVPDSSGKRHPPEAFDLLHGWDYAKLTEVFRGGWGVVVETLDELDAALARAKTQRGLSLVDLRIPQDSITRQMLLQAGVQPKDIPPLRAAAPAKAKAKPRTTGKKKPAKQG
ncbi:MAG TPA: thiamine pyrophosphate-dependent enzyme [Longimicrobiaceae bacterium]|nr:thiamine pyrophosphate-dependent enzyme [Longimicrobiaceae bacterium]